MNFRSLFLLACLYLSPAIADDAPPGPKLGQVTVDATSAVDGKLKLQPGRNITAAYFTNDAKRVPITIEFNKDATQVTAHLPNDHLDEITLEVADDTTQFADGRIAITALKARVEGKQAKLETHPGNHRIGFWGNLNDTVHVDFEATRWGMYDVELTYSLAGGKGNDIAISFDEKKLTSQISSTGSWYRYATVPIGQVYLADVGPIAVQVRGVKITSGAVMNFKAITLRPAPEGQPVTQADDGTIELDSSTTTVHGTMLRYEPKPEKKCVGFWTQPSDWASWEFTVTKPGKFNVQLTQGCGDGNGGSNVNVHVSDQTLNFTVEETGGFQNWTARDLGTVQLDNAGDYRLEVRPANKTNAAVMDIRRIRLTPIDE